MHGEPNGTSRQPRDNGAHGDGDRARIARFEGAYNRIDREMQRLLDEPREGRRRGFASAVRQIASERRHFGRHLDFLLEAGELRNALVHNRFGDIEYIAVPTEATVSQQDRHASAADQCAPTHRARGTGVCIMAGLIVMRT